MRNERTILSKVITFSNIGVHTPKNGRRIGNSMRLPFFTSVYSEQGYHSSVRGKLSF